MHKQEKKRHLGKTNPNILYRKKKPLYKMCFFHNAKTTFPTWIFHLFSSRQYIDRIFRSFHTLFSFIERL